MAASKNPARFWESALNTRILLVDDHDAFRQLLATLLERAQFEVVGDAPGCDAAMHLLLALPRERHPHVVLVDVQMPPPDGIETTRRILNYLPAAAILGISSFDDVCFVRAMRAAGARGYIVKSEVFSEIAAAVTALAQGELWFKPSADAGADGCAPCSAQPPLVD